jgi:hypothetical protein
MKGIIANGLIITFLTGGASLLLTQSVQAQNIQILTWDHPISRSCENWQTFNAQYYYGSICNFAVVQAGTFINNKFQGIWPVNEARGWVPVYSGNKIIGTCYGGGGNIHPNLAQFRCPSLSVENPQVAQPTTTGSVIFQPVQPRVCARTYSNTQLSGAVTIFNQRWDISNQSGNSADGCNY